MGFVQLLFLFFVIASNSSAEYKKPTILVSILVRNKAHTLPYFLSNFRKLNYPKERISLWIRSDHNSDKSLEILRLWIAAVKDEYHSINTEFVEDVSPQYPHESGPAHWTVERFNHIIRLRESALNFARSIWADYLLCIIMNEEM
ncbi:hypothetical protein JTB14_022135 [Gonioctena quinquepunctata]|nr:hypothetical protein JTB14_022135 [Gonioctena quinquepunctata]